MPSRAVPPLPARIGAFAVPQDAVSTAAWAWAGARLPGYLFRHSVRSYCWGSAIADDEGWTVDRGVLWAAALLHDNGLTRIPGNTMCFEVEGAERARRVLTHAGMTIDRAERVAIAIILHMRPSVTVADGVESVLLDRATAIDVRGDGFEQVASRCTDVVRDFPRGDFDGRFVAAIRWEVAIRATCQSSRLLDGRGPGTGTGLADWMARSPWRSSGPSA